MPRSTLQKVEIIGKRRGPRRQRKFKASAPGIGSVNALGHKKLVTAGSTKKPHKRTGGNTTGKCHCSKCRNKDAGNFVGWKCPPNKLAARGNCAPTTGDAWTDQRTGHQYVYRKDKGWFRLKTTQQQLCDQMIKKRGFEQDELDGLTDRLLVKSLDRIVVSGFSTTFCNGGINTPGLSRWIQAIHDTDNFSPDGVVVGPGVVSQALEISPDDLSLSDLVGTDIFFGGFCDNDITQPAVSTIVDFFLQGGSLFLQQDSPEQDAIGAALGIPSQAFDDVCVVVAPTTTSTDIDELFGTQTGNVVNQSGLSIPYTSGVTDFDEYLSQLPVHDGGPEDNVWLMTGGTGNFDMDFGESVTVQEIAIWNKDGLFGVRDFNLLAADNQDFIGAQILLSDTLIPRTFEMPPTPYERFSFAETTARYFRIQILTTGGAQSTGFGEVVFKSVMTPESISNGGAPLFEGPFGSAQDVAQGGALYSHLDPLDIMAQGGTVAATNEQGQVTAAVWWPGDYAPGAGAMVILGDITMIIDTLVTVDPLNDHGIFSLNIMAFLHQFIKCPGQPGQLCSTTGERLVKSVITSAESCPISDFRTDKILICRGETGAAQLCTQTTEQLVCNVFDGATGCTGLDLNDGRLLAKDVHPVLFRVDEGVTTCWGAIGVGEVWWANYFQVTQETVITSVDIFVPDCNIPIGHPYTIAIYEDVDGDGDLTSGGTGTIKLIYSVDFPAATIGAFNNIPIEPPVTAVGSFFVAALSPDFGDQFPAASDNISNQGASWVSFSSGIGNIDISNPIETANPGVSDNNWVLRANGIGSQFCTTTPNQLICQMVDEGRLKDPTEDICDYGDGSDGVYDGTPAVFDTSVKSVYNFTDFIIRPGGNLQCVGPTGLLIKAQRTCRIDGIIFASGLPGGDGGINCAGAVLGGVGGCGGYNGGNGGCGDQTGFAGMGPAAGGGGNSDNSPARSGFSSAGAGGGGSGGGTDTLPATDGSGGDGDPGDHGLAGPVLPNPGAGSGGGGGGGALLSDMPKTDLTNDVLLSGGAGGGGGGQLTIHAREMIITGEIAANGGAGGNGFCQTFTEGIFTNQNCSGAGAGGAGGLIDLCAEYLTVRRISVNQAGIIVANPGSGGFTQGQGQFENNLGGRGRSGLVRLTGRLNIDPDSVIGDAELNQCGINPFQDRLLLKSEASGQISAPTAKELIMSVDSCLNPANEWVPNNVAADGLNVSNCSGFYSVNHPIVTGTIKCGIDLVGPATMKGLSVLLPVPLDTGGSFASEDDLIGVMTFNADATGERVIARIGTVEMLIEFTPAMSPDAGKEIRASFQYSLV